MAKKTLGEMFWQKVEVGGDDDCWIWRGNLQPNSYPYGRITFNAEPLLAHRVSYELNIGKIPDGYVIDHICHNPKCVNPKHLRACTRSQNTINQKLRKDNTTGQKGVSMCKNGTRFRAELVLNGKCYVIGCFDNLKAATEAYVAASTKYHGEFAHDVVVNLK